MPITNIDSTPLDVNSLFKPKISDKVKTFSNEELDQCWKNFHCHYKLEEKNFYYKDENIGNLLPILEIIFIEDKNYFFKIAFYEGYTIRFYLKLSEKELNSRNWVSKNLLLYGFYDPYSEITKTMTQIIYEQTSKVPVINIINSIGYHENDNLPFFIFGNHLIAKDEEISKKIEISDTINNDFEIDVSKFSENEIQSYFNNLLLKVRPDVIPITTVNFLLLTTMKSRFYNSPIKPDFILVFRGLTQTGKTTFAGAVLQNLRRFNNSTMAKFKDSFAGILKFSSKLNDFVLVIDDFYPSKSSDKTKMIENFKSLLRIYGDNDKRIVYNKTTEIKNSLCFTCEELPTELTPSDYYRLFILDFKKDTLSNIDIKTLKESTCILNSFLEAYIKWTMEIADFIENFTAYYQKTLETLDKILTTQKFNRWKSTAAWLITQFEFTKKFIIDKNLKINFPETEKYQEALLKIIESMCTENEHISPEEIIKNAINSALISKKYKIFEIKKHKNQSFSSDVNYINILGKRNFPNDFFGFYDENFIYLKSNVLNVIIKDFVKKNNFVFNLNLRRILDIMNISGMLSEYYENGTRTSKLKVDGIQSSFVKVSRDLIFNGGFEDYD